MQLVKQSRQVFLPPYQRKDRVIIGVSLLLLLILPLAVIYFSQSTNFFGSAAGSAVLEPENGTPAGSVSVVNDPNASNGKYIRLGVGVPPTPTTGSTAGEKWYAASANRGTGDGTSRINAIFWRDVDTLALGPGDVVNFLTDVPYQTFPKGPGLKITKAGTATAPITFRGVGTNDTTPVCATFLSNRSNPYAPPAPDGNGIVGESVFNLGAGSNNLRFEYVCSKDVNIMFNVTTLLENKDASGNPLINEVIINSNDHAVIQTERPHPLILSNITMTNGRRMLDTSSGGGITNGLFKDLRVDGFSKTAMRFYRSRNNVIQDVYFDGQDQTNDHFQVGIGFYGNTAAESNHNNLILRATIKNTFEDTGATEYSQGDSVSNEEFDTGTRIESSDFSIAGDAGFDSKGKDDVVVDTTVTGAKRSYRHHCCNTTVGIGGSLTLIRVESIDPIKRAGAYSTTHLQATGVINVRDSIFTGLNPETVAFHAETPNNLGSAKITLVDSELTIHKDATVSSTAPNAQVILGNLVITKL